MTANLSGVPQRTRDLLLQHPGVRVHRAAGVKPNVPIFAHEGIFSALSNYSVLYDSHNMCYQHGVCTHSLSFSIIQATTDALEYMKTTIRMGTFAHASVYPDQIGRSLALDYYAFNTCVSQNDWSYWGDVCL